MKISRRCILTVSFLTQLFIYIFRPVFWKQWTTSPMSCWIKRSSRRCFTRSWSDMPSKVWNIRSWWRRTLTSRQESDKRRSSTSCFTKKATNDWESGKYTRRWVFRFVEAWSRAKKPPLTEIKHANEKRASLKISIQSFGKNSKLK